MSSEVLLERLKRLRRPCVPTRWYDGYALTSMTLIRKTVRPLQLRTVGHTDNFGEPS